MNDIKLIAFDLDYTLLRTGGALSAFTEETLKQAAKSGIHIVPVTGRGICEMGDILKKIPARYAVVVNGSVIWDLNEKKIIYQILPDQDKILEQIKTALTMDIYTEVYCGEVYTNEYCYENMAKLGMTEDQVPLFRKSRTVVQDLYQEIKKLRSAEKLHLVFKDVAYKEKNQGMFLNHSDFAYTSAFPHNLELSAKGVDKGSGLAALAKILQVKRENVMAIGDGANDAPMLKWAGVGIAMENAVEEAKDAANFITLSNDSDGAATAIRKWANLK